MHTALLIPEIGECGLGLDVWGTRVVPRILEIHAEDPATATTPTLTRTAIVRRTGIGRTAGRRWPSTGTGGRRRCRTAARGWRRRRRLERRRRGSPGGEA